MEIRKSCGIYKYGELTLAYLLVEYFKLLSVIS